MNRVILIGNLASAPDTRATQNGITVCTFRLAVQRRFKNQQGERESDFINIVCWRQLADICGRYLAKGRKATIEGSMQTRSYQAQDGSKRYVTEVIADSVELLTPRSESAQGAQGAEDWPDGFAQVEDELPF